MNAQSGFRNYVSDGFMAMGGLLLLLITGFQQAQQQKGDQLFRPTLQIFRATVIPKVSADPADPAWARLAEIKELTLSLHSNPADQPLPTMISLQWDEQWLYIRFACKGPKPYAPFGKEHDALHYQGDAVEVFLDPVGDGRQYFEIQLSPANGVLDQNTLIMTEPKADAEGRLVESVFKRDYWPNRGYDMEGLRTACSVNGQGEEFLWIADVALPAKAVLKRIGKEKFESMSVRMNLMRYHWTGPLEDAGRRLIPMNWAAVKFGCPHQSAAAMGRIILVNKSMPGQ